MSAGKSEREADRQKILDNLDAPGRGSYDGRPRIDRPPRQSTWEAVRRERGSEDNELIARGEQSPLITFSMWPGTPSRRTVPKPATQRGKAKQIMSMYISTHEVIYTSTATTTPLRRSYYGSVELACAAAADEVESGTYTHASVYPIGDYSMPILQVERTCVCGDEDTDPCPYCQEMKSKAERDAADRSAAFAHLYYDGLAELVGVEFVEVA